MIADRLKTPLHLALAVAAGTGVYALAALAALGAAKVQGTIVPLWPAAGVALAVVLLFGPRLLVVPALGHLAAWLPLSEHGAPLIAGAAATAGTTVAWLVMRRLGGPVRPIGSLRQVLALLVAAMVGGVAAGALGAGMLMLRDGFPPEVFLRIAVGWTVGDAIGVICVTPLLLALPELRRTPVPWRRGPEGILLLALTAMVAAASADGLLPLGQDLGGAVWLLVPFLIWSALRFGVGGAAATGLAAAAAAAFGGAGEGTLVPLLLFVGTVTLMGLLLAAGGAERRDAVAEARRLSSAVEQSAASVVITDTEGRLTYVNPRFTETSGWLPQEVLGRGLDFLRTGRTSPAEYAEMWRTLEAGRVWHGEFLNRRKDGSLWWEQASIAPVRDDLGRVTHYVAVKEDISERKETERRLRTMVDELRRSNRELQHFASIVAHDLQEPLRAISGFAQLLRKRYGDRLDAEADSYIDYMVGGAEHMKAMFRDLMDYSQVDAAPMAPADVDLAAVAGDVRDALHREITEAGADVVVGPLPVVCCSRRQMEMVFAHLVANGLKFRHPDRPPRIVIGAARRSEAWEVHVLDNGIGIPPEQAKGLFVLFRRLHTQAQYAGTGIGLAISRRIVERHGGRIWAESDGLSGTAIRFTLPLGARPPAAAAAAPSGRTTLEDLPA